MICGPMDIYQFEVVSLNPDAAIGRKKRGVVLKSALAKTATKLELANDAQKMDWVIPLNA